MTKRINSNEHIEESLDYYCFFDKESGYEKGCNLNAEKRNFIQFFKLLRTMMNDNLPACIRENLCLTKLEHLSHL
ncbi:MAG: hypothetical protein U9O87_06595 [Verrucomicrobiota bacterium]|nr:hypothetical protein [Verrucomicrobiota bacterium]